MAKMADGSPILSSATLRTLADKLYEKRKNAAREVPIHLQTSKMALKLHMFSKLSFTNSENFMLY
jgi:hypothetical protein